MRLRSSALTSTSRGVRRKTLLATDWILPSSAYVRPEQKSTILRLRSPSTFWRFRITGCWRLKRSARFWASLKLEGAYARRTLVGDRPQVRRRVLAAVALSPTRALTTEEIPQRSTESRRAFGPSEASHGRSWLGAACAASVGFAGITTLLFIFVLIVILVIDTEPEPGRDPVQTVPNSHRASLRAHPPLLASARSLPRSLPLRPLPHNRHSCPWRVPRDRSADSNFSVDYHGSCEVSRKRVARLLGHRLAGLAS